MTSITWKNEKVKLGTLIPYEQNPRLLTEKQYKDLKKSLEKFSLAEVPVINSDNTIIAGHQRIRILLELYGPEHEIDIRRPENILSENDLREYLIRSNRNTGDWDWDKLANEFEVEDLKEWGFEKIGFDIEDEGIKEKELDENIDTDNECPKCGYKW